MILQTLIKMIFTNI
jgi:hypothetical protein